MVDGSWLLECKPHRQDQVLDNDKEFDKLLRVNRPFVLPARRICAHYRALKNAEDF